MNQKILIYDLDDTLVDTSDVYHSARKRFLQIMEEQGFLTKEALEVFENIDTYNMGVYGHEPKRYKISMLQAYGSLCKKFHITKSDEIAKALDVCGNIITEKMPELISDAEDLL